MERKTIEARVCSAVARGPTARCFRRTGHVLNTCVENEKRAFRNVLISLRKCPFYNTGGELGSL